MNTKLLIKTILSCIAGIILWCLIDVVICLVKNTSFVDTFFSFANIVEMITLMTISGVSYYMSRKNK